MSGRRRTTTSNFGAGARESHDATPFYERFRPPVVSTDDTVAAPPELADPFFEQDARRMEDLPDNSVALVVTSPPYFAGKQYEEELHRDGVPATYLEYLDLLREVFAECVRTLEPGGRIAVNVANLGRKPYRSLSSDVIQILERDLGLLLRGEIIWQKASGASGSCAWGSFRSAINPVLRDVTERVVIASKGRFDRARSIADRADEGLPHESTVGTDDFIASTLDVWSIPPESARRVGHPAPFPVELPEQLIRLYTFEGDLVLDPFMGSGSTLVAAAKLGRRYVGYDLDPEYVEIARRRVDDEVAGNGTENVDHALRSTAMRDGVAAHRLAGAVLEEAGFTIEATNQKIRKTGVTVSFVAVDATGDEWFFDVPGPFTSYLGGLLRSDAIWRCLGRAAALRGRVADTPLVLLATELPNRPGNGDTALRAAGPATIFDAIDLFSVDARERLRQYAIEGPAAGPRPGFWKPADLNT